MGALGAAAAGVSLLLWLGCVVSLRAATRPARPRPDRAPDTSTPPGSPALAALLASRRELPRQALTATLLDLVARGHGELRVEDDVAWVRMYRRPGEHLAPYEELVLEHLVSRAAAEPVPLAAFAITGADATARLQAAFVRAVTDEAVHTGWYAVRCPRWLRLPLHLAAIVPFVLLALSARRSVPAATVVSYVVVAVLLGLWLGRLTRPLGRYRLTRLGMAQANRWEAARTRLAAAASAPTPTPGDRWVAFAMALDATPAGSPLAVFHAADRASVWSRTTGHWRRLTIREDHTEGWREERGAVVVRGLATVFVTPCLALLISGPANLVRFGSFRLSWVVAPVALVALYVLLIHGFRDTWALGRDFLRTPVVETADVVYTEHVESGGEYSPEYNYVALDDGSSDVVTLWNVPAATFRRLQRGDRVELRRTPVRQGFRSMTPVRQ